MKYLRLAAIVLLFNQCDFSEKAKIKDIDIQGHRGCRGLMPENSIPAMQRALDLGVNTLELDVVISSDGKVLLSHEPFLNSEICLDNFRNRINKDSSESYNLYNMTYDDIKQFDCGSIGNERFPYQEKSKVYKPLLSEVFRLAKTHSTENEKVLCYFNIEIKSRPDWDEIYHPGIEAYSDLVIKEIMENDLEEYCTIQSFDPRVLKYIHSSYPDVKLAYLLENISNWRTLIQKLGFKPEVISPYFSLLNGNIVREIQSRDILVIPWTVNERRDIRSMIDLGVDGIISDYPDIAIQEILK